MPSWISNKHQIYGVSNEDSIKYAVSDNIFIVFIQPQKKVKQDKCPKYKILCASISF